MSGYIFNNIPELKKALEENNLPLALSLVPKVDIENDEYEYLALINEIQNIFITFYSACNTLPLYATIELVAQSDRLYYSEDWPQFTDFISNIVAIIAEMDTNEYQKNILKSILEKLPLKASYVSNHGNLNYNLACYYAKNEDVKSMMEYVRRARFSFDSEKFINDDSFKKYKEENFFLKPLKNIGYTMFTWWNCLWPIEEWCETQN